MSGPKRQLNIKRSPDGGHIIFTVQDGQGIGLANCQVPIEAAKQIAVNLVQLVGGQIKSL